MNNENLETNPVSTEPETKGPDYVAKQYRIIRVEDGWKLRKERIGVAWKGENGAITFRSNGVQVIEGDVHFFPTDSDYAA